MVVQERFYTAEEFWEIAHRPEYADKLVELIQGELREMSRPGGKHGEIVVQIITYLNPYSQQNRLGRMTTETGYILFTSPEGKDTVCAPDVAFVTMERAPDGLPSKYVPFPPDLAVEVVSPNDSADEIQEKVRLYLQAGVRLVWVFYPASRTVNVHTSGGSRTLDESGTLDGGDVLPGFTLAVRDVFAV